jgi:hypothetical protein
MEWRRRRPRSLRRSEVSSLVWLGPWAPIFPMSRSRFFFFTLLSPGILYGCCSGHDGKGWLCLFARVACWDALWPAYFFTRRRLSLAIHLEDQALVWFGVGKGTGFGLERLGITGW